MVKLESIQMMPAARHIQPMGFLGCLEAIRAPTKGKARKGNRKTKMMLTIPLVPQELGGCAGRVAMYRPMVATHEMSESVASDQASRAALWRLIPPTPCLCSLSPSVTTPLYTATVSKALREALRV